MSRPVIIFSTPRLHLRVPTQPDAARLYERVFSDAEVMRWVFGGKPMSRAESDALFVSAFDHQGRGRALGVVEERDSGEVVGFSGLLECRALGRLDYEIGFVLAQRAWHKGYATELGLGQLRYGFESAGCARLLAHVAPDNARSIAVLERIGMRHDRTVELPGRGPRRLYVAERPIS